MIGLKRGCGLCGIDISNMRKDAKFCSRGHKSLYYRHTHREQYREYKRNKPMKNRVEFNLKRKLKSQQEIKELGFSKNYMRTYAKRHEQELIDLKGKKCNKCNISKHLEIHHIKYTKNPIDWIYLCQICHTQLHEPTTLLKNKSSKV